MARDVIAALDDALAEKPNLVLEEATRKRDSMVRQLVWSDDLSLEQYTCLAGQARAYETIISLSQEANP